MNINYKTIKIMTTVGLIKFKGRYLRDKQKTNWHFRKEHIIFVYGGTKDDIA